VNTGCIPSKAMVASARAAHVAGKLAAELGVIVENVRVDLRRVKARKDALVEASSHGVHDWLAGTTGVTLFEGHARFEGPHAVRVGAEVLEADKIVVNVGARAAIPAVDGIEHVAYLTNRTIMELEVVPEHLAILGGGPVGVEFAQMFRRFGAQVTLVQRGERLLPDEDEEVSALTRSILEGEGVGVRAGRKTRKVEDRGGRIALTLDDGEEIVASHLLVATGRRPNTDDLGAERAGLALDERGHVVVDDELRTSVPGVWATGEVNGRGAFTHTSYNDHEILAANLFDGDRRRVSDRIPAHAVYLDPPIGRAGLNEREVRAQGRKALVATLPMKRVGRARERGEILGFMKILVDADSRRILGATVFGVNGDEVVHTILATMYARAPVATIQRGMYIHPTVSEYLPTLLGGLAPLT
jgi:pyruvate/2-oxoglutarate dehydrogenase complex dihydrolipoamide dehydrogenase (E3) component